MPVPIREAPRAVLQQPSKARRQAGAAARSGRSMSTTATQVVTRATPQPKDLVKFLSAGTKPQSEFRIGTEHEKLAVSSLSRKRATYAQIAHILEGLVDRHGWAPVLEAGNIIAAERGGQSVTLEPGGQFELSGAPLGNLHETENETAVHLQQVKALGAEVGVRFLTLGFDPTSATEDVPLMPKNRYNIMRAYMPTKGTLGLDMMLRTCTIQVNMDFSSEAEMIDSMRISIALQPVATALFANSPFRDGKPTGYLSWRSFVWTDTDPDRSGILPFVFEEDFSFARYVQYALDVPIYFVYRDGGYIDASGQSFRDFMEGRLPALPGELPTLKDWSNHLNTIFPEVRLKPYGIEMRGADEGPVSHVLALPALWVGLLYDAESKAAARDLTRDWTVPEMEDMRYQVPKTALQTPFRGGTLQSIAQRVLQLSREGLQRRGLGEEKYLDPLDEIASSGVTLAERMLKQYNGPWGQSLDPIYDGGFDY